MPSIINTIDAHFFNRQNTIDNRLCQQRNTIIYDGYADKPNTCFEYYVRSPIFRNYFFRSSLIFPILLSTENLFQYYFRSISMLVS